MISLSLWRGHVGINGCIYRKWPVDVLEIACYVNLIVLSFTSLYLLEPQQNQIVQCGLHLGINNISIVLIYCVFTETCCKVIKIANKLKQIRGQRHACENEDSLMDYQPIVDSDLSIPCEPTVTCVDPPSSDKQTLLSPVDLHIIEQGDDSTWDSSTG